MTHWTAIQTAVILVLSLISQSEEFVLVWEDYGGINDCGGTSYFVGVIVQDSARAHDRDDIIVRLRVC